MDHMSLFSASTKDMESRTKFNNVNFSSFRGSRGKNFNFDGYQSRDANCNMFNQRNMFEYMNGFEGFSGSEPSPFDMASDRDFNYARGLQYGSQSTGRTLSGGSNPVMEARQRAGLYGGTAPAERPVSDGDDICDQPKCGNMGGVYRRCRKSGCTCTDMTTPNGQCVSEKSRRGQIGIAQQKKMGLRDASGRKVNLTPQQVQQRQIGNPVDCDGFECGNVAGRRLPVRCPNGCMCNNGSCVSAKGRVKSNVAKTNFTGANRVFPEGRGNYFTGRDMSNGGFRLR